MENFTSNSFNSFYNMDFPQYLYSEDSPQSFNIETQLQNNVNSLLYNVNNSRNAEFSKNVNFALPLSAISSTATIPGSRLQNPVSYTVTAPQQLPEESRFPVVTEEAISDLNEAAINKNTSRATKTWLNVLCNWCEARNIQNTAFESYPPTQLDKLL